MTATVLARVAVWTPQLALVTGQNMVTARVVAHQPGFAFKVFEYRPGGGVAIFAALWTALRLVAWCVTGRTDVLYLVCSRSAVGFLRDVPALALSRLGVRVVVHVHGSDLPALFRRGRLGRLAQSLYRQCEIVVPSVHLLDALAPFGLRAVRLCENFADGLVYGPLPAPREGLVVLWNSNLMATKGVVALAEAVSSLADRGIAIRLVMLGKPIGDAERNATWMARWAADMRTRPSIDLRGPVPPEAVAAVLKSAHMVALPSEYDSECQPLAVIQAMLSGRAVLVTDTAALRATVGSYPALFVSRDAGAIAEALAEYAAHPPAADAFAGPAAHAAKRFAPARFDQDIATILAASVRPSAAARGG